ncbi:DUF4124 domain-containing protein [Marinobacter confluentis]|uniref:DUF4124 domain-containing protein n=1 Tax=Marinobacter confluentis TaxID=1697557 RepID=A0A4Z1C2X7_9GAMM|nr:DUF4124 domain-containing protein [Marinobacter confluentis]TGN40491.1 DUF4124 domain-containing protein [Marinobacter confluentis]
MPGRHFVFLYLWVLASPVSAELYTWTDDQGVTHYSDRAPVAQDSEQVTLGTSSVIPMAGNVRQSREVSAIRRDVQQALERDRPRQSRPANRDSSATETQCDGLARRISQIQQRLRAGYSNDRGNSLRRQRRELSQKHSRECILG